MLDPGTVVIIDFQGAVQTKRRPALVVSTAAYNSATPDVVLAILTGQTTNATGPTDYILKDWLGSGLARPSAFRAFLRTEPRTAITRVIGKLSDRDWQEVQSRLRLALAVT